MNIKKTLVTVASVVLAFASVTASAVNIPQPKNNAEAYAFAKSFYNDGYYYEAKAELEKVNPTEWNYDAEKTAAWMDAVDAKIEELQYNETRAKIKAIIAEAKKLNSQWRFVEALDVIESADSYSITISEYELLRWWEEALIKNLNSPKYAPVRSNLTAIEAVKNAGGLLNSAYETYFAIKVAPLEWHVYITTRTPAGTRENVAAYRVYSDATVIQVLGN